MTVVEALPMDIQDALYHYCMDNESLNDALIRALHTELFRWHDLRKDPEDLPTDKHFKITSDGDIALYDWFLEKWYDLRSCELTYHPAAWCEIPRFEDGE